MEKLYASLTVVILTLLAAVESATYDKSSNISTIPYEAFSGDPVLWITYNHIAYMPCRDAFLSYTNLRKLYLKKLGLRYIEDGAFNGQYKLEEFTSDQNFNLELPSDLGSPTKSLVHIIWWNTLPPHGNLASPYFAAFENLTLLNIGGNWLSTFQPDMLPPSLLYIHLGYSVLPVFPEFAICAPLLETVLLYRCGMLTISIKNLTGLTEVKLFDLE